MMKFFGSKVIFLLLLTVAPSAIYGQAETAKSLTLEESVQLALNNSTATLKAKNAIEASGAQVLAAYGQFLPDFAVGAGYTFTSGTTLTSVTSPILVDSRRSNVNYSVLTTLNIFNGYSDYATLKATRLSKEANELTLERARQFIVLDVTQSYLQITLDKQIAEFAGQNFQASKKREEQLEELVKVGRRAQSDLYQQQSQTALDQQYLTNAENKLRNDKILMLQKLRIDATAAYEFNDPIIDESPLGSNYDDEQALVQKAISQRADLKSSHFSEEAAQLYIKKYRGGYLPKLFFSAGAYGVAAHYNKLIVNGTEPSKELRSLGTQLGDQVYGAATLNGSWTIFDKYYTRSNVRIAKVNADNARIDYENVNLQIIAETRQAYGNYSTALSQVETTEKGLIAAQRAYETVNGRYAVGAANFIEVVITQNNLLQAKQNRAQVAINLYLQKKTLDYFIGN